MPVIKSKLKTAGADFSAARDAMRERIAQLEQITANTMQGGGEAARARHISRGKMLPREAFDKRRCKARRIGAKKLHHMYSPIGGER